MNALWAQLAEGYRKQEELYDEALALVGRQQRLMESEPDPTALLALCDQTEKLMARIAAIEQALAPAKEEWEKTREDPTGELRRVLGSIEALIGQISRGQEAVQALLLAFVERQRAVTEAARADVKVGQARRAYDTDGGKAA